MRRIAITITKPEQRDFVRIFKALRIVDPTLELGPTMANLRSGRRVLELETDCATAVIILSAIQKSIEALSAMEIEFTIEKTEQAPTPMVGAPPIPKTTRIDPSALNEILLFEAKLTIHAMPAPVNRLLVELKDTDWFSQVGMTIADSSVGRVDPADLSTPNPAWEYAIVEVLNVLSGQLCYEHHYWYVRRWNPFARLLKPHVDELIEFKKATARPELVQHEEIWNSIRCVVTAGCIEEFFSDVVTPSHGASWLRWLLRGHIPCGWTGLFPDGQLLVW